MAAPMLDLPARDPETADMGDSEPDDFEQVFYHRNTRKRKKIDFSIESLKAQEIESDSNVSFVEASTEQPSPLRVRYPPNPLKLLIVPIEEKKNL